MAIMALAGGLAKGIATKALVKKPKINAAKFAGKVEDTKAKATAKPGGSLVPSPGGSIVKIVDVKVDPEKKVKVEGDDPLIREVSIIYQRTIDIQKALRNEQKAKKKRATKKLKADEKKKRNLKERLSELAGGAGKAVMGAASKAMAPAGDIFNNLLQGISMLFLGWLSNHLPKILGFAERVVNAISTVGKFLSPIIGFVWDALKWIVGTGVSWIAKLTGSDSEEADNKTILGNIADIQKKIPLIEAAFAAFIAGKMISMAADALDFVKEHKKTIKKFARKVYRKLPKPVRNLIRKTTKALTPKNILKKVKSIKPVQTVKNLAKKIKLPKPQQAIQNVTKRVTENLSKVKPLQAGKNLLTKLKPKPGGGGGWLKGIRGGLSKGWNVASKAVVSGAKATGSAISGAWKAASEWTMKNLDSMWKGAKEWGAKQAKKLGDIVELAKNPGKLAQMMKGKLMKNIDDVVKKNKTLKSLVGMVKNPKKIMGAIKGMLNTAKKSKGILNVKSALSKAKSAKVAGIDKIITAVMSLIDYMVLKESPINAIVKGVSGMLGYAAGFAIGAPFGGMPGFITGSIGGALGELAGYGLLKGFAKAFPGLTETPDPIMGSEDEKAGLPPRPLLRDPDSPMDHMIKQDDGTYKKGDIKDAPKSALEVKDNGEKSNDASQISESASYDTKGGHGTGGITPVPVEQMTGGGGGNGGSGITPVPTGVNKHEVAKTAQKTKDLAKLASE